MLISLLLIAIATAGGFALSYLVDDEAPLMWRFAAGNIIGSSLFGTAVFVLALIAGLNTGAIVGALLLALLPIVLFYRREYRRKFEQNWSSAKGKLQGFNSQKFLRFAYYAFFFLLFFFFFDRSMLESTAGIFTGGSQNLGDLPFHLGAIFSFTEGNNFPPENPSFAGARFSYPFIADLLTACSVKIGASVRDAMFVQNVAWAFSLLIILERFVLKLTRDRLASRLAPWLLFFSGGLGFLWFFSDYAAQTKGFFDFLSHLPKDYTIGEGFRWGNSMVVLFMTQRSLLLGMPLTLIVLGYLWKVFTMHDPATQHTENSGSISASPRRSFSLTPFLPFSLSPLLAGLLAGLLPLIHLHSLAVLFVVGVFLFVLRPEKWMTWVVFAAGVAVIALPELLWSMSGSASETSKFFEWHFGWDKGDKNFLWFWFTNTGFLIPLIAAGLYVISIPREDDLPQSRKDGKTREGKEPAKNTNQRERNQDEVSPFTIHHFSPLLWFYLPFAFLFVVSNIAKLAPWEWDNIKVLIYWFVGSLPIVTLFLSRLWHMRRTWAKAIAAVCFLVLIGSGSLDVWRAVSAQINYKVFDKDAVEIAQQLKTRVGSKALFLNAPTYNSAVVLTGRRSLMRYTGHLSSHGIDYGQRESDVKKIYQGGPDAAGLLEKYGIEYVVISPEEKNAGGVNEQFFSKFPISAESGQYRVYKIK
ncbi:MAG: hypothetical protein DMF63_08985 [Acidobacteria bacterium]|nr:MAG: hypothetical protein DMF63_08985 [Acidobacteriota bacterium]